MDQLMTETRKRDKAARDKGKRPYFSRQDRRRKLLDTAAAQVESEGWDSLSMSALAQRSGISRQLVYQHFPNLEELMVATGTHIFQQTYLQTRDTIAARKGDVTEVVAQAQRITLDLPPGRARALWQVIAAAFPPGHELNHFGRRMRHLITNLWKPAVAETFGLEDRDAGAITWLLIMAFWGGYRLMEDGEFSKQEAIDKLNWLVSAMAAGAGTGVPELRL